MAHLVWSPDGLNAAECSAILAVVAVYGRKWKPWLLCAWEGSSYPGINSYHHSTLQLMRNTIGPSRLQKITLSGLALQLEQNAITTMLETTKCER